MSETPNATAERLIKAINPDFDPMILAKAQMMLIFQELFRTLTSEHQADFARLTPEQIVEIVTTPKP